MANPDKIVKMVDYSVDMFKRMISHTDSSSNKKFIECNFTYVVTATEIICMYLTPKAITTRKAAWNNTMWLS